MTVPQGYVPGRYKIDDYGNGGFRFADMSHRGSILALPTGVRAVAPTSWKEIDAATIDLALAEGGGIDLLIVGMGKDLMPLAGPLRARLRDAGVGCEPMATGAAVRTYNMLLDEGRQVGALLIAV
ncbi:Mth938-like domain-containing protein [Methylocystis parvus]|uniref:Mth938-like domain-containing protein n=1 Tax=Methylocystis parvus TaxID=134 RepID=UPI003C76F156